MIMLDNNYFEIEQPTTPDITTIYLMVLALRLFPTKLFLSCTSPQIMADIDDVTTQTHFPPKQLK